MRTILSEIQKATTSTVAGGLTFAQETDSCVINSMPQEAVKKKAIDRILTPEQIGTEIEQLAAPASSA